MKANEVLKFWFEETNPELWFKKDNDFDERIKNRFSLTIEEGSRGELFSWRETAQGRLAEIIVLDQFPRNIYRQNPKAWATDGIALTLAQELVSLKLDTQLTISQRAFAYLPYMHSESLLVHKEAVKLFKTPGLEDNYKYEIMHLEIIEKFGRYPHRNKILGRESTPEEIEFLKTHQGF